MVRRLSVAEYRLVATPCRQLLIPAMTTRATSRTPDRFCPGENAGVAYQLRILDVIADAEPAGLIPEVSSAISSDGSWERFVEVRMSAGPTVRITSRRPSQLPRLGQLGCPGWASQDPHASVRDRVCGPARLRLLRNAGCQDDPGLIACRGTAAIGCPERNLEFVAYQVKPSRSSSGGARQCQRKFQSQS